VEREEVLSDRVRVDRKSGRAVIETCVAQGKGGVEGRRGVEGDISKGLEGMEAM
jgi:hypothetical protein